jgi:hypothetical protein
VGWRGDGSLDVAFMLLNGSGVDIDVDKDAPSFKV